ARTPSVNAYSSLMRLSTSTTSAASNSSAGWKRPQREPTTLISRTTTRAVSNAVAPWKVDLSTSTPRGRKRSSARSKPAAAPDAAEHRALRAMPRIARATQSATPTARVDLADHAAPDQFFIIRALNYADELVPQRPLEARVAAHDLKVGVADAGERHAHQRLA